MAEPKPSFADALKELTRQRREQLEPLTLAELSAYVDNELDEQAADRIRQRLSLDPEGVRTVQQLRRLAGQGEQATLSPEQLEHDLAATCLRILEIPETQAPPATPETASRETESLESTATAETARPASALGTVDDRAAAPPAPVPISPWWRRTGVAGLARAAGWLVAALVLAWHLQSQWLLQPLREPDAALQRLVLKPSVRAGAADATIDLAAPAAHRSSHLVLEIVSDSLFKPESLKLELRRLDGGDERLVWRTAAVTQTTGGGFQLLLPRRFLDNGTYQVVVTGARGDQREEMASYRFVVEGA